MKKQCSRLLVKLKYKRKMNKLRKAYFYTCWDMAFQGIRASRRLKLKWKFQQKRIKILERYLSMYGR